jgi:hypothetical protein
MGSIIQHIPNFVDKRGLEIKSFEFSTLEELFAIPFVKYWQEKKGFYRWSITNDNMLMAEQDEGENWWVVGYIKSDIKIKLPEWKPIETKEEINVEVDYQPTEAMSEAIRIFRKSQI